MSVTVVSFYTVGTPYEEEAGLLKASLRRVGMDHLVEPVPDRGSWDANTAQKVDVILGAVAKTGTPILYVDADAFFHENCSGFFAGMGARGIDFGAHWFRGPAYGHDRRKVRDEGWWFLSGTMFFGQTPGARRLLDAWKRTNLMLAGRGVHPGGGQENLRLQEPLMETLNVERVPGSYCWVFDKPWAYLPGERPIIEHLIASRIHRRGMSQGKDRARTARIAELRSMVGIEP